METLFLKQAKRKGLKVMNGLYMLIAQAVKAQEIWHDITIDNSLINIIYHELG
jgi:shikimate dehydrogenase